MDLDTDGACAVSGVRARLILTTWVELQDGTSEWWNASCSAGSHLNMAGNTVTAVSVGSSDVSSVLSGIYGAGDECQGTPSPVDCSSWAPPSPAPSQVNVPPMVTFSPLTAVLAGGSAQVVVSFSNGATSSPVPITLTLKTTSRTGAAGFAGAGPTMTITKPTTVTITGLTASSTANNILLDATISGAEGSGTQEDATDPQAFSVQQSCFAQLKYRAVEILGIEVGNHSYWWFEDHNGVDWVTDAGPTGNRVSTSGCGYLDSWLTPGNVGHYPQDDANTNAVAWASPVAYSICANSSNLITFQQDWQQNTTKYAVPPPPNSNTYAHEAGTAAPFTITTPPPNAPGW